MIWTFSKIRPPIKIHGGKYYLAKELCLTFNRAVGVLPGNGLDTYASVFGGGFSDGLNIIDYKQTTIYNDIDPEKANLFTCLRDHGQAIQDILAEIEYDEDSFKLAKAITPISNVQAACAFIVRSRFSRGGLGKDFAWSDRERGGQPGDKNSWDTFRDKDLPRIIRKCQGITVSNCCYWEVTDLLKMMQGRILAYFDPPYPHGTRTSTTEYGNFELPLLHADKWRKNSHEHLLGCILECNDAGIKCVVSGYHNSMYDSALKSFNVDEYNVANHSSQVKNKERRTEVVWRNF